MGVSIASLSSRESRMGLKTLGLHLCLHCPCDSVSLPWASVSPLNLSQILPQL